MKKEKKDKTRLGIISAVPVPVPVSQSVTLK